VDEGQFRAELMRWYARHGRHELPWRRTRDPYAVLVSEVMLQQTQVERVRPYYKRWLERWPSVGELAKASPAEVIREWAGLGYNRRALYLQRMAVAVMERYGGTLPLEVEELRTLPGIGPYTASAVACFAGERRVPVADTNIQRVLARAVLGRARARDCEPAALRAAAERLLPEEGARAHNLALMDLGAMVCASRAPQCDGCPVAGLCRWRLAGQPEGETSGQRTPKFEHTARFARGRIVDALRTADGLDASELAALLPDHHRDHVPRYLRSLEVDGLIEQDAEGRWRLPGQGRMSMASPKL